ncbi:N-acetyl-gamma-glutamyl-phosphate reductase [Brockia lithotrophica]|uniref:N-acetyl-gamma-glutamyl-phosphate reductase n=1 Tax=Brockia lithotrophica TaxID=933949 RepID=A0A660L6L5_9BACL|nr:N-acetyl-gamma-glutamyl-phosphate reductase [Brockia lithotrophica]
MSEEVEGVGLRVGVVGTGYGGTELVRLLTSHPHVDELHLYSESQAGKGLGEVYAAWRDADLPLLPLEALEETELDVLFLATPHGASRELVTRWIGRPQVIVDLSGDFRFRDGAVYERFYRMPAAPRSLLEEAVYGLAEFAPPELSRARLVANPGCFPTAALLALLPLAKAGLLRPGSAIVDAKTGVSGAGRSPSLATHFSEVNENVRPYNVFVHRHGAEIEVYLGAGPVSFVPHLVPMTRGILVTAYGELVEPMTTEDLFELYRHTYAGRPFVRLLRPGTYPETKAVQGSNFVDIGLIATADGRKAVVMAAIDNLVKGAAGQAVQNMNLRFGLPETAGLVGRPLYP